ncbi:hypothetical protein [Micromonospora musae]|uniref:hypothetical protein n=1 Tax=Micromonospora musae TaxID=1894970 RepID=UPI0011C419AE|nr:hypothetical protein [Micromonospora musae]
MVSALDGAARRTRRWSWVVLPLALAGVLVPDPASAHPFGAPQRIDVAGDGDHGVRVHWIVGGTDDLTMLGIALGVLGEDRVLLDGAVTYEPADARALGEAPEFATYLTDRIAVTQDGQPCTGAVDVADDLAADGAEVLFTCPAPVSTVTVTSRMLTDLHEAYRTFASGPDGQKAVYDGAHESADWRLPAGSATGPRAPSTRTTPATATDRSARQLLLIGAVLLAAAAAVTGAFWYRRRRLRRAARDRTSATTSADPAQRENPQPKEMS